MSTAPIQIVTVAFGSDQVLPTFLESVSKAAPKGSSTIVVDNAPDLGDAAAIAKKHTAAYLALNANPGYGGGINASRNQWNPAAEFVLIANPDVVFSSGAIAELASALQRDPELAAVGPQLQNPDGSLYPSARAFPTLVNGVGHALFHGIWPTNPWTAKYHARNEDVHERDCDWLSGACILMRREAFDSVGGFDESFFMYFEDVDIAHRLHRAGWRIRYIPNAVVTHLGAHSTTSRAVAMKREHHRSAAHFISKLYPYWYHAFLRLAIRLGLRLRNVVRPW